MRSSERSTPVLNETIRPWVSAITAGRYDDVKVNPATLELEAQEAGGSFRPTAVLSHGTTEQLSLLLRIALAQHLTTSGERAPLVLDDITVHSDAERTRAMLKLLHHISTDNQVVLFSQEEEVLRWAETELTRRANGCTCSRRLHRERFTGLAALRHEAGTAPPDPWCQQGRPFDSAVQ
jgi:DNA repair protein SbcC/Rad50